MSYELFWDSTPAEITYWLDQMNTARRQDLQMEATFTHWLAVNIAHAYNDPKKIPRTPRDAFPSIFKLNEADNEELQIERFIEGAKAVNRRKRGGSDG